MHEIPEDFRLSSYTFELPEERIAQAPSPRRDASRLLVLDRASGAMQIDTFASIVARIPDGALLVANNSKVLPARVFGRKPSGGRVEFLLLTPLPLLLEAAREGGSGFEAEAEGLLRASKGPRPGERITFDEDFRLTVLERGEFGRARVRLAWRGDLAALFLRLGH